MKTSRSSARARFARFAAPVAIVAALSLIAGCGSRLEDSDIVQALAAADGQRSVDATGSIALGESAAEPGAETTAGAGGTAATASRAPATTGTGAVNSDESAGTVATGTDQKDSTVGTAQKESAARGPATTDTAGGTTGKTGVKSTLVFGNIGSYSGLFGVLEPAPLALAAWVAMQNARGGLDGHPIKLIVADDAGDPSKSLALAKRMVEQDKIIAFAGNLHLFGFTQVMQYAKSKSIPLIGGEGIDPGWFQEPLAFPSQASVIDTILVGFQHFLKEGATRLGMVYCVEVARLCSYINDEIAKSFVSKNMEVSEQVSLVAPSYTSQCLRMQAANVEVVYLLLDIAAAIRFTQNCATQGYNPKYMAVSFTGSKPYPAAPTAEGSLIPGSTVPMSATQLPAMKEYKAAIAKYAPGLEDGGLAGMGWANGLLLGRAGAKLSGNPTALELMENLWRMKKDTLGGFSIPLTFVKNKPAPPSRCAFLWGVKDGDYSAPFGTKPVCL